MILAETDSVTGGMSVYCPNIVEGTQACHIALDTGRSHTMVCHDLVPEKKQLYIWGSHHVQMCTW